MNSNMIYVCHHASLSLGLRTVPYTVYGRKVMVPDGHGIIRTPFVDTS